jgi:hypothetical protein
LYTFMYINAENKYIKSGSSDEVTG